VGGKYRLDAPIGRGGMASVWRARHLALDSDVAVKLLEYDGADSVDRMKGRFEREAKLAAGIKHRNVVDISDYGVTDDGRPFMVMELLTGQSLGQRLDGDRPITDAELFYYAAQVLSGLAAAHDQGVIHRDVKPENVFLVEDADGEFPKLLDFGISRATAEAAEARVTKTGVLVGTPLYMSPEQARGLKDVDARTDLWSVGAVLYEALAGRHPFESEHVGDILIRIATEDLPPITQLRPDLPKEAGRVVMKALRRKREARWQSAREMRDALMDAAQLLGAQAVRRHDRSYDSLRISLGTDPTVMAAPAPDFEDETTGGSVVRAPDEGRPLLWIGGAALAGFVAVGALAAGLIFSGVLGTTDEDATGDEAPVEVAADPPPAPVVASNEPAPEAPEPEPTEPDTLTDGVEAPEAEPEPAETRAAVARARPARRRAAAAEEPAADPAEARAPAGDEAARTRNPRSRERTFLRDLDY